MPDSVERRVEDIVAEHLGLGAGQLDPTLSLRDDLAADSLDLLELSMAIEDEVHVSVPERLLSEVRTVGELVTATLELARANRAAAQPGLLDEAPVQLRARITPAAERGRPGLATAGWLTPYVLQQLVDAAMHAGPGATVEVTLAAGAPASAVGRVLAVLRPVEAGRGITVDVHRDGEPSRLETTPVRRPRRRRAPTADA